MIRKQAAFEVICATQGIYVQEYNIDNYLIRLDGHTVTFSATDITIADDTDRYKLSYPRVPATREWMVPMQAMEELTALPA